MEWNNMFLLSALPLKVVALENENIVKDGPVTISSRSILKSASMYASEYKNMHNRRFVAGTGNASLRFIDVEQSQTLHLWRSNSVESCFPYLISSICCCGSSKMQSSGTSWIATELSSGHCSKQEQIHNSIVSNLLALMDGLDSRGQVVLVGATNRIHAIDGALRRPGRYDRDFTFQLPGLDACVEILDILTRKWKQPPVKELKLELVASCVGYCGADLKALCTEAAIHAFCEKYPQVYTSDDKFLIDVESVEVEKKHFMEAMSAITRAAHRDPGFCCVGLRVLGWIIWDLLLYMNWKIFLFMPFDFLLFYLIRVLRHQRKLWFRWES
ncbi:unnamed protein product [Lactuca saligna]|uniref:Vesicle-fusing ATPase n=1 Tax=Lactuca saligna TaxID=75948 RepID=A0AA36EJD7_LACSI|nr:unnamed protein product [Lactuca saligna]